MIIGMAIVGEIVNISRRIVVVAMVATLARKTNKNILLKGDNMYIGCDLSIAEWAKDFELLGCTHDEAIELGKLAIERPTTIIDPDELDRIVEAFNNVGEVYPISAEDLKKALERYENESN